MPDTRKAVTRAKLCAKRRGIVIPVAVVFQNLRHSGFSFGQSCGL
jgi:hypothetical protein